MLFSKILNITLIINIEFLIQRRVVFVILRLFGQNVILMTTKLIPCGQKFFEKNGSRKNFNAKTFSNVNTKQTAVINYINLFEKSSGVCTR